MWWEWVVRSYIVLWVVGTVYMAINLFWHSIRYYSSPLAQVCLPLAILFWFSCWRAFLFHQWALIATCILGWFLTVILSAHTSSDWDRPKYLEPFVIAYWFSTSLFTIAVIMGWKHWLSSF